MNTLFEPVTIVFPAESKDGPQKAGIALKESSHAVELRQAWILKNWHDRRDVELNLQNFVDGLAHVGSFNLDDAPVELVQKPDGTTMRDPRDLILTGQARASDTVEFIENRVFEIDLSNNGEIIGKPIEGLVKIYNQYREIIVSQLRVRNTSKSMLRDKWKLKMQAENISEVGLATQRTQWDDGVGLYYQGYLVEQNAIDEQALPEMKKLLTRLSTWQLPS